ncbi:ubiquitin-activating E1 FCCH domain-containing protein [Reyranella sp.]|uniref:ubiquitin-activating E1 FCCH domain-containing protein n=1 Tax=Reyranella sp. TaxID=1929291 RepID=UPI003BA94260
MTWPILLPSFAAGELAPSLQGRVDLAKYQVGLATCLNWFVHPFGGVSTRAGTAFVGDTCDAAVRSRLIPFSFNTQQTYVLEFGDRKMRVVKEGGYVLEAGVAIADITRASPGVVTTAGPHGLSSGDAIWLDGIEGMRELNRRRFTVTVIGGSTFALGIDTSGYGNWTEGGTAARVYTIATPYPESDLARLKYVQSADTMTLTHPSHAPRNLTRTGHASWSLATITYAPTQQPPTALASTAAGSGFDYVVTAVAEETGEESVASASVSSNVQTSKITWTNAAGANSYNVYKGKNGVYGFIGRAGDGATGFTDTTVAPDTSDTPPEDKNPFDAADKYPGCSTYHEGRQWYARTNQKPQTLYSSASAAFNNMNTSSPSKDSDAITRTIASREVNEIRHLLSLNVLLVWTSGAVWKAWAGAQADVMTPANCAVKPQSYEGISEIPPIATESAALYVTASAKKVRDVAYDFGSDSWAGRNVSILAGHLFETHGIEEWAYARDPHGIVWCVRSDGVLLAFTYLKEHDVYAWSRHVTDGRVESVAAVQEADETVLYLSVKRTVGGETKRFVERMATRGFKDVQAAWCVDSGIRHDGWNSEASRTLAITGTAFGPGESVTLTAGGHAPFSAASVGASYILRNGQNQVTVTVVSYIDESHLGARLDIAPHASLQDRPTVDWALAALTLGGLWHLEGRELAVLADGSVQPNATVSNGTIVLPRASGSILAGLPYVCDLETLNLEAGPPTLQGRQKVVNEVVLRVKDTRGLSAGPTSDRLVEIKERAGEQPGYPTLLTTGDERVLIDPDWNAAGRVFVRQAHPLPATLLAIIPRLETGA